MSSVSENLKKVQLVATQGKIKDSSSKGLSKLPVYPNPESICILNLSNNNLRSIPPEIRRLSNLKELDLSKNPIKCVNSQDYSGLATELCKINLRALNLAECNFPIIPPTVWLLKDLERLDISRNKVNYIPKEIAQLTNLKYLIAQYAHLNTLPIEIALCTELEELILWGNHIETLPDSLRQTRIRQLKMNMHSFHVDEYMEKLIMTDKCESIHIPNVLFEMPLLQNLDLEACKINFLPDSDGKRLKRLNLARNFFRKIPKIISEMQFLQSLDFSFNLLTNLLPSGCLSNLKQLKSLNLERNKISDVGEIFEHLTKLTYLNLTNNCIRNLPESICNLQSVKVLLLSNNQIKTLPLSICKLKSLNTLDLSKNQIEKLPNDFALLEELAMDLKTAHGYYKLKKIGLWLTNNPIVHPPPDVWQTEKLEKIYTYLKRMKISQTPNLQALKIFLLGDHQAGKSSFLATMITGQTSLLVEDGTEIFDRSLWRTRNNVQLVFIDFGGKEFYHHLYRYFMTGDSLYIIFYDHSTYTHDRHWEMIGRYLDMIRVFSPGAVVKLIGTKTDLCENGLMEIEERLNLVRRNVQLYEVEKEREDYEWQLNVLKNENTLEYKKLEKIVGKGILNILPNINTISVVDDVSSILQFVNELEMIAINKTLFPYNQRYITDNWNKFKVKIKLKPGLFMSVDDVKDLAKLYNCNYSDVIRHLVCIGDIVVYRDVIFHKPTDLVDKIRLIVRDIEVDEKLWKCRAGFRNDMQLNSVKGNIIDYGKLSWKAVRCMVAYDKDLDDDGELREVLEMLEYLGVCYNAPLPDIPTLEFQPALIVPYMNLLKENVNHQVEEIGNVVVDNDDNKDEEDGDDNGDERIIINNSHKSFTIYFTLKKIPKSYFYTLSCRIQSLCLERNDYENKIIARFENGIVQIQFIDGGRKLIVGAENHLDFQLMWKICLQCLDEFPGIIYRIQ